MSRSNSDWLRARLGYPSRDEALIEAALTHRSAGGDNNERLEFLGDGVLNCVIADLLYREFPDADEGELSRLRATLVRQEALAQIAGSLDLGAQLRLGPGELRSGGHRRESILADALEALIGAIYRDAGLGPAQAFIRRHWRARLEEMRSPPRDPKTSLQEWAQGRGLALPDYQVVEVGGAAHAPRFEVSVRVAELPPARAVAGSKRAAERAAAEQLLAVLEAIDD